MRVTMFCALAGVCLFAGGLRAETHGSAGSGGQKLLCVVPMVGAGTLDDPRRPMFTPGRSEAALAPAASSLGFAEAPRIQSFHAAISDDNASAIVEFVAHDPAAFKDIKASSEAKVFDRQKNRASDVQGILQKYKKDFRLEQFEQEAR